MPLKQPAVFLTSVFDASALPPCDKAEIAFIGRSNAGKSTLLNSIVNQKRLAFAGRTPGLTQSINFFTLGEKAYLVDLPGYGFRQAAKKVSKNWHDLVDDYLKRTSIKLFLFLCDIRRDLDDVDIKLLRLLCARAPTIVVLTKADKLNNQEKQASLNQTISGLKEINIQFHSVVLSSATKKTGSEAICDFINSQSIY